MAMIMVDQRFIRQLPMFGDSSQGQCGIDVADIQLMAFPPDGFLAGDVT